MDALAISALSPEVLARRLGDLVADERQAQVDFLLHLGEFDARRAWLLAGYESLWAYCLEVLHLREGPAGRRINAMRILRHFPTLEGALRDGRLCMTTITVIGPLLTPENLDELVARAAYKPKSAVEQLVASLQPRTAPKDGIRRLPQRDAQAAQREIAPPTSTGTATLLLAPTAKPTPALTSTLNQTSNSNPTPPPRRTAELTPISSDEWSLRVTIDASLRADLLKLEKLVGHKCGRDLSAVLREAVRCAIEHHGKRKGAVKPSRERKAKPRPAPIPGDRSIPVAVRREVWERDGGCCAWTSPDGRRCRSEWKLQFDHIQAVALGGTSTVENLRVSCALHNALHAEQTFGREHMARFHGRPTHPGMSTAEVAASREPDRPGYGNPGKSRGFARM